MPVELLGAHASACVTWHLLLRCGQLGSGWRTSIGWWTGCTCDIILLAVNHPVLGLFLALIQLHTQISTALTPKLLSKSFMWLADGSLYFPMPHLYTKNSSCSCLLMTTMCGIVVRRLGPRIVTLTAFLRLNGSSLPQLRPKHRATAVSHNQSRNTRSNQRSSLRSYLLEVETIPRVWKSHACTSCNSFQLLQRTASPEDQIVVNPNSATMHVIAGISTVEIHCGWLFDGTGQRAKVLKDANFFCCGSCFSARISFFKIQIWNRK